jgi:hypothetical protein
MRSFPKTKKPLVLRTDYESHDIWDRICELIRAPQHDADYTFFANVEFLEDPDVRNLTAEQLLTGVPDDYVHSFLFVVDNVSIESPEFPILVIDLRKQRGRTFRAIPSQIQAIENNLSIANMDFAEFADNVGGDGVFRGFRHT